jgi:dihydroorotate dehydrogenase electron transfer subunit
VSFVLAGKSKSDLIFLDDILNMTEKQKGYAKSQIILATEDGSYGKKGLATDVDIPKPGGNYYLCGPEIMMQKVAEKIVREGVSQDKIYLSMERYMKCAVGICGNCSFSGYRVCADGPVFRYDLIKDLPHFSRAHRTRTGELIQK